MRKIKKKSIALLIVIVLFCRLSVPVSAAEYNTSAVYDLIEGGTQTFSLQDSSGRDVVITITELPSVNSPYYTCFIGSIHSAVLKKNSSKQATLSFIYKAGGINNSTGVRTNIVNNQLRVSVL